jgi:hypothetical protein
MEKIFNVLQSNQNETTFGSIPVSSNKEKEIQNSKLIDFKK